MHAENYFTFKNNKSSIKNPDKLALWVNAKKFTDLNREEAGGKKKRMQQDDVLQEFKEENSRLSMKNNYLISIPSVKQKHGHLSPTMFHRQTIKIKLCNHIKSINLMVFILLTNQIR